MIIFDESSKEFLARNIADMGKAILTVGFASYFFEKLPLYLRIAFVALGFLCLVFSLYIHATRKGGSK